MVVEGILVQPTSRLRRVWHRNPRFSLYRQVHRQFQEGNLVEHRVGVGLSTPSAPGQSCQRSYTPYDSYKGAKSSLKFTGRPRNTGRLSGQPLSTLKSLESSSPSSSGEPSSIWSNFALSMMSKCSSCSAQRSASSPSWCAQRCRWRARRCGPCNFIAILASRSARSFHLAAQFWKSTSWWIHWQCPGTCCTCSITSLWHRSPCSSIQSFS